MIVGALPLIAFLTNCCVIVEPPWTRPAVGDVGPERAQDAAEVDAAVLVEALVLDRDDRLLDPAARSSVEGTITRACEPRRTASIVCPSLA